MENFYEILNKHKKRMGKNPTFKELSLRKFLKAEKIDFKCQHIIPPYIVDFYFPKKALIIEIDGGCHNISRQKERDYKREDYLMSIGYYLERFTNSCNNDFILKRINNFDDILDKKKIAIEKIRQELINLSILKNTDYFRANNVLDVIRKKSILETVKTQEFKIYTPTPALSWARTGRYFL